jgi:hypothetical protein
LLHLGWRIDLRKRGKNQRVSREVTNRRLGRNSLSARRWGIQRLIALFPCARRGNTLTNNEHDALPAEPVAGFVWPVCVGPNAGFMPLTTSDQGGPFKNILKKMKKTLVTARFLL